MLRAKKDRARVAVGKASLVQAPKSKESAQLVAQTWLIAMNAKIPIILVQILAQVLARVIRHLGGNNANAADKDSSGVTISYLRGSGV
jgi:hypothetical protein